MSVEKTYCLRSRWLIPVEGPAIRDGILHVQDGRVLETGHNGSENCYDLGRVAILPALVNAHTHLEFSGLDQPLGSPASPFTDWIRNVIRWRREGELDVAKAIAQGIDESRAGGAGVIGEIATSPLSLELLSNSPLGSTTFLELIGLSRLRIEPLMESARAYLEGPAKCRRGISPHAPYTINLELLEKLAALSREKQVPLAMHLAETEAELELLRGKSGPFVPLLESLGAWESDAICEGTRPLDFLNVLRAAERALVIHGNYLSDEEQRLLAESSDRLSLVYCPRTHAYFGHSPYPITKLLGLGVRVALGTDSRASNPDLSIWKEMQYAVQQHPDISPESWLRIATLNGAEALGVSFELGSLTKGKSATFVVIDLPEDVGADPWNWIADPRCQPSRLYVDGLQAWPP